MACRKSATRCRLFSIQYVSYDWLLLLLFLFLFLFLSRADPMLSILGPVVASVIQSPASVGLIATIALAEVNSSESAPA